MDAKEIKKCQQAVLDSHGIFELRGIGRYFGVHSPTTKKREVLVKEILECLEKYPNGRPPHVTAGRPYKELDNIVKIVDRLKVENICGKENPSSIVLFAQNDTEQFEENEPVHVSGVIIQDGKSFIDTKSKCVAVLKDEIAKSVSLGDHVLAVGKLNNSTKTFICDKIIKINGVAVNAYKEPRSVFSEEILHNKSFTALDKTFVEGGNNLTNFKLTFENRLNFIADVDKLSEEYEILVLGSNLCKEDILAFNALNFKVLKFISGITDTANTTLLLTLSAISHAERLSKLGKNVILFAYDINTIIESLKNAVLSDGKPVDVQQIVAKLQTLSTATTKGNNITLISTYEQIDLNSSDFVRLIYKTSSNKN